LGEVLLLCKARQTEKQQGSNEDMWFHNGWCKS
jgi:hypothetical protein